MTSFSFHAQVAAQAIEKVGRLFNASFDDILAERLKNARRRRREGLDRPGRRSAVGPAIRMTDDGAGPGHQSSFVAVCSIATASLAALRSMRPEIDAFFQGRRRRFLSATTNGFFPGFMMARLNVAHDCLPSAALACGSLPTIREGEGFRHRRHARPKV